MWAELKRIRKDNTAIALFGTEPFSSYLRLSNLKEFKYDWIWHKNTYSNFASSKYNPLKNYEFVHIFGKGKVNYYPIKEKRTDVALFGKVKRSRGFMIRSFYGFPICRYFFEFYWCCSAHSSFLC